MSHEPGREDLLRPGAAPRGRSLPRGGKCLELQAVRLLGAELSDGHEVAGARRAGEGQVEERGGVARRKHE